MGSVRYEVVIVNARTSEQASKQWSGPELLTSVPWLKRMNAEGADIYIRPLDGPELLLVDGLSADALKEMRRTGFAPAVIIEAHPGRFQGWVKLSDKRIREGLRKQAVTVLSGVLPKISQYGRLAGFTNQKVAMDEAGRHPYVLAHDGTGMIALAAGVYPTAIEAKLQRIAGAKQVHIEAEKVIQKKERGRGPSL